MAKDPTTKQSTSRTTALKVGQRSIVSCSFCYRRKIKCDKQTPCSNCVSRGIASECFQPPVIVRGTVIGGKDSTLPIPELTHEQLLVENAALRRKLASQEKQLLVAASISNSSTSTSSPPVGVGGGGAYNTGTGGDVALQKPSTLAMANAAVGSSSAFLSPPETGPNGVGMTTVESPTTLLSSGAGVAGSPQTEEMIGGTMHQMILGLPLSKLSFLHEPHPKSSRPTFESTGVTLLDLVPVAKSTLLVESHFRYLLWVHASVNRKAFMAEHDVWIEKLKRGEKELPGYDFLAQYFFIIAASVYFLDAVASIDTGYSATERATLPKVWTNAGFEAIRRSDFMFNPTLKTLQALCILPMIGHAVGESISTTSLMRAGIPLTQPLNIQQLESESSYTSPQGAIERELGRRVWSCLAIDEVMTASSQQRFVLLYPTALTGEPTNIEDADLSDEHEMVPRPWSTPTVVSHVTAIARLSEILRQYQHAYYRQCTTVEEQFALALLTEPQIHSILDFCPTLRNRPDELYPEKVDENDDGMGWLSWSRHLMATILPHSMIQVYRPFLSRGFMDQRFNRAREACLEAARSFIAERQRPTPPMYRKIWHLSAQTVLSAMILVTELVHGEHPPSIALQLRGEILSAIQLLERDRALGNAVTGRGVDYLRQMMSGPEGLGGGGLSTKATTPAAAPSAPMSPVPTLPPSLSFLLGPEDLAAAQQLALPPPPMDTIPLPSIPSSPSRLVGLEDLWPSGLDLSGMLDNMNGWGWGAGEMANLDGGEFSGLGAGVGGVEGGITAGPSLWDWPGDVLGGGGAPAGGFDGGAGGAGAGGGDWGVPMM